MEENTTYQAKNKKSIPLWVGVNKSGRISIHAIEPVKNNISGRWESKDPFCHSIIQGQFEDMIQKVGLTWENECEYIEVVYE
jgi:hypothetical protein